nr:class I SAM-dependent methyltransferase [uncultured Noviherbaspirillum sp.]
MAAHAPLAAPSLWVQRFAPLAPAGDVLDLACGSGRHVRLLAALGHPVLAVDRDPQALAACAAPGVQTEQHDLENGAPWPYPGRAFAGIVVTNYLHRPLFEHLFRALAPGGVLIYETFAAGNGRFGKPSNPDFLLRPGELIDRARLAGGLRIVAFEDGYLSRPKPAMVQRICVVRPANGEEDGQAWPLQGE